jgi:hypothetical protein
LYTDFLYMYILEPTFKDYITKKCKDYWQTLRHKH